MTELKPCPFCGNCDVIATPWRAFENVFYKCICPKCGASVGSYDTENKAVEAWNRRNENAVD